MCLNGQSVKVGAVRIAVWSRLCAMLGLVSRPSSSANMISGANNLYINNGITGLQTRIEWGACSGCEVPNDE